MSSSDGAPAGEETAAARPQHGAASRSSRDPSQHPARKRSYTQMEGTVPSVRTTAITTSSTTVTPFGQTRQTDNLAKKGIYSLDHNKDTRGGFLVDDAATEDPIARKRREKQLQQMRVVDYPTIHPDPNENPKCVKCGTIELDFDLKRQFNVNVCAGCRDKYPDEYSLLTKTEVKQDYLLTDSELRDTARLPHISKPNPLKSTYSNMLLYLRGQCEAFAIEKWGSLEALDAEFHKRQAVQTDRKQKKFQKGLAELRRKTQTEQWEKRRDAKEAALGKRQCEHTFNEVEGTSGQKKCIHCGMTIEEEEF